MSREKGYVNNSKTNYNFKFTSVLGMVGVRVGVGMGMCAGARAHVCAYSVACVLRVHGLP